MEVDGGVVEPHLGAYADLPLSPLPLEEDLLVLLGDKPAATEQNPSPPLQGTEQEGQLSLETFLGEKSPHLVTVPSEESLLPGPSVEPRDQSAEPGFQGEPQQPASGSLEEVPDVAHRDEEAGSAQPQGTSSGVIRMCWVGWTSVSARIPAAGLSVRVRSAQRWWTMPCQAICPGMFGAT